MATPNIIHEYTIFDDESGELELEIDVTDMALPYNDPKHVQVFRIKFPSADADELAELLSDPNLWRRPCEVSYRGVGYYDQPEPCDGWSVPGSEFCEKHQEL